MDLLGALNPAPNQAQAQSQLTAQQQAQQQELANLLKKEGQTTGKFTSPWQVAGQWAQALKGGQMQSQLNPGYQQINKAQPMGDVTPAPAAPTTPAAPPPTLPWSGSTPGSTPTASTFDPSEDLYAST